MLAVTETGAIDCPPVPAFYQRPQSVDETVNHTVGRALDLFDVPYSGLLRRWEGMTPPGRNPPRIASIDALTVDVTAVCERVETRAGKMIMSAAIEPGVGLRT